MIEIYVEQMEDVSVLTLMGSIDAFVAPTLTEFIQNQIANGHVNLVADFSAVDFISSAGLRVLLGTIKETRARGGDFVLASVRPDVLKVLELSGFTRFLKIFDRVSTAAANFQSPSA